MDRVLALHAGSRGFNSHRGGGTCLNDFSDSNRPGYPHPVTSELENSGIKVAVGDCSVTECRRWHPLIKPAKLHVHAEHYKHNKDGRTVPGVCSNGPVPLSHSGERRYENWNTHVPACCVPVSNVWVKDLNFLCELFSTWIKAKVNNGTKMESYGRPSETF